MKQTREILEAEKEAGYSHRTLVRAKEELKIRVQREEFGDAGVFYWQLLFPKDEKHQRLNVAG